MHSYFVFLLNKLQDAWFYLIKRFSDGIEVNLYFSVSSCTHSQTRVQHSNYLSKDTIERDGYFYWIINLDCCLNSPQFNKAQGRLLHVSNTQKFTRALGGARFPLLGGQSTGLYKVSR